jgi:hypothetical protein
MDKELHIKKRNKFSTFIFFGNYFYGICSVALSIEALLQQGFPLNGFLYFVFVFISTVLYYTYPYAKKSSRIGDNPRTNWYSQNYVFVRSSQIGNTIIVVVLIIYFVWKYGALIENIPLWQWALIFIFPFIAALYYGTNFLSRKHNLRRVGWLKPFVIGFIWAGFVTIYPVLFYCIVQRLEYNPDWIGALLFLKNLMFISVLCIMFDIKDYASDYTRRLKTFVVKIGLRKTIFYILLPLSVIGLASFIYYSTTRQFSTMRILLNVLPFILLIIVAFSLQKRRSIMYYLVVVDGLMLVKAICGSIAMIFFS